MFKRMVLPAVVTVSLLYGGMVMAVPAASGYFPRGNSVNIAQYADKGQDQDTSRDNNANENDNKPKKHKCCDVKAS